MQRQIINRKIEVIIIKIEGETNKITASFRKYKNNELKNSKKDERSTKKKVKRTVSS